MHTTAWKLHLKIGILMGPGLLGTTWWQSPLCTALTLTDLNKLNDTYARFVAHKSYKSTLLSEPRPHR